MHNQDATLRRRADKVLLRPIPPLLRGNETEWPKCPAYFTEAYGSSLTALDGHVYLDLEMGRGPNILGYRHPVTEDARRGVRAPFARAALYHESEIRLAEEIVSVMPCAELVVFGKNGSDATSAAIRIARVATGRSSIVSSGYHGFGDWCIADTPGIGGVPPGYRGYLSSVTMNDEDALLRAIAAAGSDLAAIIVEPAHRLLPSPQFLLLCREAAHRTGALLIFDEVVTSFRIDIGGAQSLFGVTPDLACLGKAMTNGLALSALVGRRELIRLLEQSFFSMTYAHDIEAFVVGLACVQHLRSTQALAIVASFGERLRKAFDGAASRYGLPARALGFAARLDLDFPDVGGLDSRAQRSIFGSALLENDILPTSTIFACEMLTEEEIERASMAFSAGMARIASFAP